MGSPLFSCKLFKKGSLEKILTLEKANKTYFICIFAR